VVDGDEHMRKRPIGPLVEALRSMGIDAESIGGYPPVTVRGTGGFPAAGWKSTAACRASMSPRY
jgi:3-phosphoshikimate 1-carboxyvinyltransferase